MRLLIAGVYHAGHRPKKCGAAAAAAAVAAAAAAAAVVTNDHKLPPTTPRQEPLSMTIHSSIPGTYSYNNS